MTDEYESLAKAARQLIDTDRLLGSDYIPARPDSLPQPLSPEASAPATGETADQKAEALKAIDEGEVKVCTRCPLHQTRMNTVFGEGSADADLVFVGEGPGADEDRTGRPFVGRAGELLAKMIAAMGLSRKDVFICNILKCRPPGNRSPAPEEITACWNYLIRQLDIIRPKVIVALGNPATQNLLNTRTGITKIRGNFQPLPPLGEHLAGPDVMPTFHPALLPRQYSPDNRRKVWDDLQKVMAKLGLKPPKK